MRVTVKKWGNSAAVRIPAPIMEAMKLHVDEIVEIREDRGRIVIEPIRSKEYSLDDLVAGITPENVHPEVDFGEAVGKERW